MIRKFIIAGLGCTVLGWLCFGRDIGSYYNTAVGKIKNTAKDSVPVQFEIDRARQMVKDLAPEIQKNMQVIAKEEVEVERLEKQIKDSDDRLNKDRNDLSRLKNDLSSGKSEFTYGGRTFTVTQVKCDLGNRLERCKTNDATVTSLKQVLQARTNGLDAAKQKLEGMLAAKRRLDVEVENLDARQKAVEVAQTTSEYSFDDSHLSRVKELITDLRCRIDVSAKMLNAQETIKDQIPLDTPNAGNVVDEVAAYLGQSTVKVASVEKAAE